MTLTEAKLIKLGHMLCENNVEYEITEEDEEFTLKTFSGEYWIIDPNQAMDFFNGFEIGLRAGFKMGGSNG